MTLISTYRVLDFEIPVNSANKIPNATTKLPQIASPNPSSIQETTKTTKSNKMPDIVFMYKPQDANDVQRDKLP